MMTMINNAIVNINAIVLPSTECSLLLLVKCKTSGASSQFQYFVPQPTSCWPVASRAS